MENFSKEISDFKKNGTYDYKFDEGGNLTFNKTSLEFNQHYLSIPLINYGYDNTKISSFYDLSFKEFVPTTTVVETTTTVSEEMAQLTEENQSLKDKLSDLTQTANANMTESERLAIKQVILGLRIQLKQGSAERDFSIDFPYLPLTKTTR
jgi:hypothetical protein